MTAGVVRIVLGFIWGILLFHLWNNYKVNAVWIALLAAIGAVAITEGVSYVYKRKARRDT